MPKHRLRSPFRPLAILAAVATLAGLLVTFVTGGPASSAVIPTPAHTVIVVMENHSYSQVIGAPYISTLAKSGANMTDSHGVRHPSQPNYLAIWSGSTQGLTDDSCPHTYSGNSLGAQLLNSGRNTAIYSENLPAAGSLVCSASGGYARKHNPLADFPATSGAATNLPFTAWPASDFSKLPTVSMVVPNLCNDMHDCSVSTGDNWLKAHMDPYVQWAKTHNSLFILTFDEDDFTTANRIPTIFVGPMVRPGNYPETINHYNVLHTVEAAYGLPQIGVAAAPITDIWASTAPSSSSSTSTPPTSTSAPGTSAWLSSAPPSTQPPSSTPPAPTTSSPPPVQAPLRGAFYYPWFPGAWTQNGQYPYTHYHPTAGLYSSTDPALIAYEVAGMRYAGLDFAISSWWGQGSREDQAVPAELAAATGGFKWTLYYEPEGTGDPSVSQISSDLGYIASRYATSPTYLTVGGKPVLFVYGSGTDNCSTASRWKQANAGRFYIALKVFSGYRQCADQPDSWHQYGPASATDSQAGYSYSVSPGFWKADETTPRLARDLTRWKTNLQSMVASGAPWQLVTTWNEWGEGTSGEDGQEWSEPGIFGAYIQAMHDLLG
jgi:hypothetical protein